MLHGFGEAEGVDADEVGTVECATKNTDDGRN